MMDKLERILGKYVLQLELWNNQVFGEYLPLEISLTILLGILTFFWFGFLAGAFKKKVTVAEIWIYPIKSCKGICLQSAVISSRGFLYDRLFAIADKDFDDEGNERGYKVLTQRTHPAMTHICTSIDFEEGHIIVACPGMDDVLIVPLEENHEFQRHKRVRVWGDQCESIDCGDDAAAWLLECLSKYPNNEPFKDLRLVRMADDFVRSSGSPNGQTAFADAKPFLLMSTSTVDEVIHRCPRPVSMMNFRPNIVVKYAKAFAEDQWTSLSIGDNPLVFYADPCSRCKLTTNDPDRGEFNENDEPMRSLKAYRTADVLGITTGKPKEVFYHRDIYYNLLRVMICSCSVIFDDFSLLNLLRHFI